MASRCRSLSNPAISLLKFSSRRHSKPVLPSLLPRPIPSFSRLPSELAGVQSLLPLHSAVSSARLTSCLGIDSRSSKSLSQEMGLSVPR
ncbi:protein NONRESPONDING TO OXYLIPINS 2, mitochondrial isoform X2 [Aristolochia californica]|uniref:protein NONRESPONDING TO OXYLIPINS 2, mitochondrial isoform X2 n=1 Tax=Aristolochia californica TaxID=171875 RepID=UPI0035DFF19A